MGDPLKECSLKFQNTDVTFVENHKHLRITFSQNGQWNAHIDSILKSSSMRKLKFTLNRKSLNQIYISYVAPLLEYVSIIWDGCTDSSSNSLQKIQNEATRIVTGLTRSVSLETLFLECGWQSLKDRRETQKMYFMYKAIHQMIPQYTADLILPLVADTTPYAFRN